MSILLGLNTALRGLMAQQQAINTVTHNISNANTPGFSRQDVVLETTDPFTVPTQNRASLKGQVGTGVTISQIRRIRDGFLDTQFRQQNQELGFWEAKSNGFEQIEGLFNEPSDNGLGNQLGQFWNRWRDLTNDPRNQAMRLALKEQAANLASFIQSSYTTLTRQRSEIDKQIVLRVAQINSLAAQIASLNEQIQKVKAVGDNPNDLEDRRDLLLDEMTKLIRVSSFETDQGVMVLSVGGVQLVGQGFLNQIDATQLNASGYHELTWESDGSNVTLLGGELKGFFDLRDTIIPDKQAAINALATALITEVNAVHSAGYGQDGVTTGLNFFSGTDASDVGINATIAADPTKIAAATVANAPGDGSNAAAIGALQFALVMGGSSYVGSLTGTASIDSFYQGFISTLGVESQQAQRSEANVSLLIQHIEAARGSTSGVSLDEEAANMIKYQRAYEASARMVTTLDSMLDTLINRTGIVGR